jgi:hypothetical protein
MHRYAWKSSFSAMSRLSCPAVTLPRPHYVTLLMFVVSQQIFIFVSFANDRYFDLWFTKIGVLVHSGQTLQLP